MARRRYRFDRLDVYVTRFEDQFAKMSGVEDGDAGRERVWIEDDAGLRALDAVGVAAGERPRLREMRHLLEAGGKIMATLEDGAPAGWYMFEPYRQTTYQWLHIEGDEHMVFALGGYVRRDRRGLRIGPRMSRQAGRYYSELGFDAFGSVAAMENRSSRGTHAYVGGRHSGWLLGLRLASGRAVVASDRGLAAGRYLAGRPFVYPVRRPTANAQPR
jgi:hypothetical protein